MKISFRNDYSDVGHPEILKALTDSIGKTYIGYGEDEVTANLKEKFCEMVKDDVDIYILSGGTQTNLTLISKVLLDYEAVIAVESGHINVHETGAIEGTGHKIITVPGFLGKLYPQDIDEVMAKYHDKHMVKPKMVYISNATEIGTIYTKTELKALYERTTKYGLILFLDGARLPIALTAQYNDLDLINVTKYTDAYYIGGTKNGMPYGELLVIKSKEVKKDFAFHLKNKGSMLAKSFVGALMFEAYFKNDLYLILAKAANQASSYLREALVEKKIQTVFNSVTNQIFIVLPNEKIKLLLSKFDFEIWEEGKDNSIIRLVTSWHTSSDMCKEFIEAL